MLHNWGWQKSEYVETSLHGFICVLLSLIPLGGNCDKEAMIEGPVWESDEMEQRVEERKRRCVWGCVCLSVWNRQGLKRNRRNKWGLNQSSNPPPQGEGCGSHWELRVVWAQESPGPSTSVGSGCFQSGPSPVSGGVHWSPGFCAESESGDMWAPGNCRSPLPASTQKASKAGVLCIYCMQWKSNDCLFKTELVLPSHRCCSAPPAPQTFGKGIMALGLRLK